MAISKDTVSCYLNHSLTKNLLNLNNINNITKRDALYLTQNCEFDQDRNANILFTKINIFWDLDMFLG